MLAGGPAPGGHDVICGIFDRAKIIHPDSHVFGFVNGPNGILSGESIELTQDLVDKYRNQGGFNMIGSNLIRLRKSRK